MKSVSVKGIFDINVQDICFDKPVKNKYGSYISNAYIKENNEKKEIFFQTDKITSLDGIICNETRSYIEIEFNNKNSNLYDFISSLEEHCIITTHKNSNFWFNQKFPLEVVDDFFKSSVKPARSNKLPSIKFKIPISRKKITAQIYNQKKQLINYSNVLKNNNIKLVVKFEGIKFLKQQCLCELFVLQIKYYDPKLENNNSLGYILQDSDNEEEYNIPNPLPNELDILMNNDSEENEHPITDEIQENFTIQQEKNEEEQNILDSDNKIEEPQNLLEQLRENNIINGEFENIDLNNIENVIELSNKEKQEIQQEIDNSKIEEAEKNLRKKEKEYLTALNEFKILTNLPEKINNINNDDIILSEDAQNAMGI
jgi:hypothetical protein